MKILVVTLSNLGDVVLTLPVFQALKKRHPNASLDVVVGESGKIVFERDERIRRVIVYDKKMSWPDKARFWLGLHRQKYDKIVDLRHAWPGGSLSRRGHRSAKHLRAAGLASAEPSWLEGFASDGPAPVDKKRTVVCAPGSKSDLKKWPAERYAEVLHRLATEQDCSVVLVGDKNDVADAEKVKRAFNLIGNGQARPIQDLTGKTDFRELVSVLRKASLVLTNDSAPLHIADSLKVPTLAIFGPSDPKKYGPRHGPSLAVSLKLFCQPCERAQCPYGHECMKELETVQVYAKAVRALEQKTRGENFKVLVVRLDRIGDLVLSLPALEALRGRFPDAGISVMARPATRELLEGHPAIDEVIAYDYGKKGRHAFGLGYFRFLEEIMKRRFDAAVVLHPGIRSYLVLFLAGIPHRIGYRNKHAWLLTRAVPDERRHGRKHESQYALDLVAALTGVREGDPASPELEAEPSAHSRAKQKLGRVDKRWVALHPGASCPSKRWPAERFKAVAQVLTDDGYGVVVVGGEETRPAGGQIASGTGTRDLTGQLSLKELTALLSRCELLISNDSGPVHIAAAVGTRVISIFGRNQAGLSPQRWRPLGQGHAVIQKDVGCVVCLAHECPIEFECLKAITVEDVMSAVRDRLREPITAQ